MIMATGDNVLTALNIARQCKLTEEENECLLGEVIVSEDGTEVLEWKSTRDKNSHQVVSADFKDKSIELGLTGKALQFLIK
jgi:magnesium-transporting ATPase (P-type)